MRTFLATLACVIVGCGGSQVDLGKKDDGTPMEAGPMFGDSGYTYPAGSCPATCGSPYGTYTKYKSDAEVSAHTVGRWISCGGMLSDAPGIEFATDGKFYVLRKDASGNLVRGTDAKDVGTWVLGNYSADFKYDDLGNIGYNIDTPEIGQGGVNDFIWAEYGFISDCPRRLRLLDGPPGMYTDTMDFMAE